MEFSRQEYWSGLPGPTPRDLPHPGTEPASIMSPALAGGFFTISATCKVSSYYFPKYSGKKKNVYRDLPINLSTYCESFLMLISNILHTYSVCIVTFNRFLM